MNAYIYRQQYKFKHFSVLNSRSETNKNYNQPQNNFLRTWDPGNLLKNKTINYYVKLSYLYMKNVFQKKCNVWFQHFGSFSSKEILRV